ncbi:MAG TPA: type II CAAX endopeptidase family protein [Candidatus Saccharimonadales bacterium]
MSEDSSKPEISPRPWGWVAAIGIVLLALAVGGLAAEALRVLTSWPANDLTQFQDLALGLVSIGVTIAAVIAFVNYRGFSLEALGFNQPKSRIKASIALVFGTFGLYFLTSLLAISLLSVLLPNVDLNQAQDLGLDEPDRFIDYGAIFLLLVLIAPLSEEIIFRGFMFQGLTRSMRWQLAAIISAALFGLAHGQLNVGIDTGLLGLFSAWLVHHTGSIWPSIGLHVLKNLIAYTLVFLLPLLS